MSRLRKRGALGKLTGSRRYSSLAIERGRGATAAGSLTQGRGKERRAAPQICILAHQRQSTTSPPPQGDSRGESAGGVPQGSRVGCHRRVTEPGEISAATTKQRREASTGITPSHCVKPGTQRLSDQIFASERLSRSFKCIRFENGRPTFNEFDCEMLIHKNELWSTPSNNRVLKGSYITDTILAIAVSTRDHRCFRRAHERTA